MPNCTPRQLTCGSTSSLRTSAAWWLERAGLGDVHLLTCAARELKEFSAKAPRVAETRWR